MYLSLCLEDIVLSEGTHKLMCYIGRHVIKPFRTHDVFHVTSSEPDTVISQYLSTDDTREIRKRMKGKIKKKGR